MRARETRRRKRTASIDREFTNRSEVFAVQLRRSPQNQTLRAGNRFDCSIIESGDPRYGCSVVETHHQFGVKRHLPRPAHHDAHEVGNASDGAMKSTIAAQPVSVWNSVSSMERAGRYCRLTSRGVCLGASSQRPFSVSQAARRSKLRSRNGARTTIDGAVAANQSRRFAVANHCVVFDSQGHSISSVLVRVQPQCTLGLAQSLSISSSGQLRRQRASSSSTRMFEAPAN